jgi:type II secretory pathway pseudopilin PulG
MRGELMQTASTELPRRRQAGFTVIEMVVTLGVLVMVLLGVLALFEMANRVGRVQVDVADMQQTLRSGQYHLIHMLRMAGRGNLPDQGPVPAAGGPPWPDWTLPTGFALSVANNTPAATFLDNPANTVKILENTDVLTLRGAFSAPVYTLTEETFDLEINPAAPNFGLGSVQLRNVAKVGVEAPQPLRALVDAISDGIPEALILVSPLDDQFYHVVELDPARCVVDDFDNPTQVTLAFRFINGTHTAAYWRLSGNGWDNVFTDPTNERSAAAYVAILEEYRFFVRDRREIEGDALSPVHPELTQARFFPGTNVAYRNDPSNLTLAVADGVADLQLALGIESGGASAFEPEDAGNAADEWLFNHVDDDPNEARWRTGQLYYVRITTTTVTARRDRDYTSPATYRVEDHQYNVPAYGTDSAIAPDRTHRRRQLRTVVDLRNL